MNTTTEHLGGNADSKASSALLYKRQFAALQFFRCIITVSALIFLTQTFELGTPLVVLIIAGLVGVYLAGRLLKHGRREIFTLVLHAGLIVGIWAVLKLAQVVTIGASSDYQHLDFLVYRYSDHIWLIFLVYVLSFGTSWFFWRSRQAVTFEAIIFASTFVWLLSGHRNYHLDAPKSISSIAWAMNLAPQHLLLALGLSFSLFLGAYFVLAHERPIIGRDLPIRTAGKARRLLSFLAPTVILLLFVSFATFVNHSYSQELDRASNGVGMKGKEEGDSPLGFHSAIGQTRQPAALVRLEGDYSENPWSPMLYLREGALSNFNGREYVVAAPEYDTDAPRITPGDPYNALISEPGDYRKEVLQSMYLLTKHAAPFAIDFPQMMRVIKNPDEQRFTLAYQARSYAPTTKAQDLIGEEVGDPGWSSAELAHYLRAPGSQSLGAATSPTESLTEPILDQYGEDLRYLTLARQITADYEAPVSKAIAISQYLSEESIYTRSPGHTTTPSGDPVAPYLFSEAKRGYCVHFAHAAVYMMRLMGIPSRIATGYLTDLTYAKDGHILLHLGDRHAWPEIYVRNHGWVVVDIMPANAENEQAIVPDERLLEELMSQIDPGSELTTPPPPAPEDVDQPTVLERVVTKQNTISALLLLMIIYLSAKLYLRFGWKFAGSDIGRARKAYTAFASFATDLGLIRSAGETRREYATRLHATGLNAADVTLLNELYSYSQHHETASTRRIEQALREFTASASRSQSRLRRFLAFLSPLSLVRFARW